MLNSFRLSETAKAVLWLWQNDADNWTIGTHAVVHRPTGVGVWTANDAYGLHINYDIPECDRKNGHASGGRELRLRWRDRRTLWRMIGQVSFQRVRRFAHQRVQQQISDWAADNIPNRTGVAQHTRI